MHEFPFKDLDKEGLETLLAISEADAFNKWMYTVIAPYLNGDILEIGSGIGNISRYFISHNKQITLSDIRNKYCGFLSDHFQKPAYNIDLVHERFDTIYKDHIGNYDSLFALNVIEHIKDDSLALTNASRLIRSRGTLVILVPAFPNLYNVMDKELHHFRRYSRKEINEKITAAGFKVKDSFYFNALGIAGWKLNGITGKKQISKGQMSAYNNLVPIAKVLDLFFKRVAGLSVISVSEKM